VEVGFGRLWRVGRPNRSFLGGPPGKKDEAFKKFRWAGRRRGNLRRWRARYMAGASVAVKKGWKV